MTQATAQQATRRPSIPLLWIVGAVAVFFASWLGSNVSRLDQGGPAALSPFFHYGLSVGIWFLAFAGGYLLIERVKLPFQRTAALIHFGLMASGTVLIITPSMALGWLQDSIWAADHVSLFRLMNAVSTVGYGLTFLAFVVFLGALGRSLWIRIALRRTEPSAG